MLTELRDVDAGVPLVAMTYYNLVYRPGEARFAQALADAGVSGAIVPDIPLEEAGPWCDAAEAAGVDAVLLAAPTATDERLARICERSRGFVYGVSLLGTTGERDALSPTAVSIARRLKSLTDLPVVVGHRHQLPAAGRRGLRGGRRRCRRGLRDHAASCSTARLRRPPGRLSPRFVAPSIRGERTMSGT